MGENTQPYYEGQKIVRTGPTNAFVEKGKIYTAHQCYHCPCCGKWGVTLKEFPCKPTDIFSCCVTLSISPKYYGGAAHLFAPIETQYADATADILEKFPITEETPDRILKPETVNN